MTPPEGETNRRHVEFLNLEPLADTDLRKERKERDSRIEQQFVPYGDDLWELRTTIGRLSDKLVDAIKDGTAPEISIRDYLLELERRDPELVYKMELAKMMDAEADGRLERAQKHKEAAMAARSCLPQFNLEGLWVGK